MINVALQSCWTRLEPHNSALFPAVTSSEHLGQPIRMGGMHRDALFWQLQDSEVRYQMKGATTGFHDCRLQPTPSQAILSSCFQPPSWMAGVPFRPFEHQSQGPALPDLWFLLVVLLLEFTAHLFSACLSAISDSEDLHSPQQPSVRYSRRSSKEALPSLLTLVKLLGVFSCIISSSC